MPTDASSKPNQVNELNVSNSGSFIKSDEGDDDMSGRDSCNPHAPLMKSGSSSSNQPSVIKNNNPNTQINREIGPNEEEAFKSNQDNHVDQLGLLGEN